jgi:NitT/TauT family transport system substrate-binding protein
MGPRTKLIILVCLLCLVSTRDGLARIAVKAAYNSLNANSLPAWIAREKGFFAKHDLDVSLVYILGPLVIPALGAKEVDFSFMGGTTGIQGNLAGLRFVFVATTVNRPVYSIVTRGGLKTMQDLKGRSIGVSRYGGATHMLLRHAFQRARFDAESTPKVVQLFGSQSELLLALLQGRADGVVLAPPVSSRAKSQGLSLINFDDLVPEYLAIGLATRSDILDERPHVVDAFLKAYVEAVHFLKTQKDESMQVLGKYLGIADRGVLAESYDLYRDVIPARPLTTATSIQVAMDMVQHKGAPERFFNNAFVESLDRRGFIGSLYDQGR